MIVATSARTVFLVTALALTLACERKSLEPRYAAGARPASITVTSPAFTEGGSIPVDHTCDGSDAMPELVLSAAPEGAKSLVVYVDDPDAIGGTFTHMIAFDVAPTTSRIGASLEEGGGASFGVNDFGSARYQGPCPPRGELHRYRFRVLALDTLLGLPEGATRQRVDEAIDGHVLGEGTLSAQFGH